MAKTEKELLQGYLTRVHNISDDEFAELVYQESDDGDSVAIKEDALNTLIEKDANRVKRLKGDKDAVTKAFNDGAKKREAELMGKLEKDFKEKTGFESEKQGLDLFVAYGESVKSGAQLSDDEIKKHPAFLAREKQIVTEWKDRYDKLEGDFTNFKGNVANQQKLSTVKSKAEQIFTGLNPVLSQDTSKAAKQKQFFLGMLDDFNYQVEGDDIIILDSENKRKEDKHGNPVQFEAFVRDQAASLFDFKQQDTKGSAGNDTGGAGGGTSFKYGDADLPNVRIPKDKSDYNKMLGEAKTDEERIAIGLAWEKAQES